MSMSPLEMFWICVVQLDLTNREVECVSDQRASAIRDGVIVTFTAAGAFLYAAPS